MCTCVLGRVYVTKGGSESDQREGTSVSVIPNTVTTPSSLSKSKPATYDNTYIFSLGGGAEREQAGGEV